MAKVAWKSCIGPKSFQIYVLKQIFDRIAEVKTISSFIKGQVHPCRWDAWMIHEDLYTCPIQMSSDYLYGGTNDWRVINVPMREESLY